MILIFLNSIITSLISNKMDKLKTYKQHRIDKQQQEYEKNCQLCKRQVTRKLKSRWTKRRMKSAIKNGATYYKLFDFQGNNCNGKYDTLNEISNEYGIVVVTGHVGEFGHLYGNGFGDDGVYVILKN